LTTNHLLSAVINHPPTMDKSALGGIYFIPVLLHLMHESS